MARQHYQLAEGKQLEFGCREHAQVMKVKALDAIHATNRLPRSTRDWGRRPPLSFVGCGPEGALSCAGQRNSQPHSPLSCL